MFEIRILQGDLHMIENQLNLYAEQGQILHSVLEYTSGRMVCIFKCE